MTATSQQQPLSSVPQVAIVERFNCILLLVLACGSSLYLFTQVLHIIPVILINFMGPLIVKIVVMKKKLI